MEDLAKAAQELGRVRGAAAEESLEREGDAEAKEVLAGAFDRLFERFEIKVRTALETLRDRERYDDAIRAWARRACETLSGPWDVHAAPEDRERVYEAFLEHGASDFQVHVDRAVRTGFVVRDIEGRTLFDRRPDAIVEARREDLRSLLRRHVPDEPTSDRSA